MAEQEKGLPRLAFLLAMAMFVFVIDTSLMNVSISAVVRDLDTTVSGVQTAVALEALVSAAFILIGSKLGDLRGRKRAYVVGLAMYVSGAVAATALCRLVAGTDQDDTLGNGTQFTLANLLTHEFAAAGTVDFRCSTGGAQSVAQIRIVAIKVGNLTAS